MAAVWTFQKLRSSGRFAPSEVYMQAVLAAVEEEATLTLSLDAPPKRSMPAVPTRHTLYTLKAAEKKEGCVCLVAVQLISPRVQSDAAVVILAAVNTSSTGFGAGADGGEAEEAEERVVQDVAGRLPMLFPIGYPATRVWTSVLSAPSTFSGSFLFRQGQLVLQLAAGDVRYHGVRVVPTAGKSFSTLGSLTVSRVRGPATAERPSDEQLSVVSSSSVASSPTSSPGIAAKDPADDAVVAFASLSAVWTLVADGRSAADYVDFIITEGYYDSGVFNLNNVGQRTTASKGYNETLLVRERGRNATHRLKLLQQRRASPSGGGNGLDSREVWSAWVDVGSSRRCFLCAQERDVGQLLLIQAQIEAQRVAREVDPSPGAARRNEVERREEVELEAWVFGVMVGTVPRYQP